MSTTNDSETKSDLSSLLGGTKDFSSVQIQYESGGYRDLVDNDSVFVSTPKSQNDIPGSTYNLLLPEERLRSTHDILDHAMNFDTTKTTMEAHTLDNEEIVRDPKTNKKIKIRQSYRKPSLVESLLGDDEDIEKSPMSSVIFNMLAGMGVVGLPYTVTI